MEVCWCIWLGKRGRKVSHLDSHSSLSLCEETTLPILFGGDFNEILSYDEKEGGANRVCREMTNV